MSGSTDRPEPIMLNTGKRRVPLVETTRFLEKQPSDSAISLVRRAFDKPQPHLFRSAQLAHRERSLPGQKSVDRYKLVMATLAELGHVVLSDEMAAQGRGVSSFNETGDFYSELARLKGITSYDRRPPGLVWRQKGDDIEILGHCFYMLSDTMGAGRSIALYLEHLPFSIYDKAGGTLVAQAFRSSVGVLASRCRLSPKPESFVVGLESDNTAIETAGQIPLRERIFGKMLTQIGVDVSRASAQFAR